MNRFKLVVFDLDGTLTPAKSIWEHIHRVLGTWENYAEDFQRLFLDGSISYQEFCERDAMVWKGMSLSDLRRVTDSVPYQRGARQLTAYLRGKGLKLAVISSGLSILTRRIEEELRLDFAVANDLLQERGILTGKVRVNVPHNGKGYWMKKLMGRLEVRRDETMAIGDSQGDLDMFAFSGFRVAFNSSSTALDEAADAVVETADMADIIPRLPL